MCQTAILAILTSCLAGLPTRTIHSQQKAGWPLDVHWLAVPTYTHAYDAGYVGGDVWFKGEPRHRSEGTWGMDYRGWLVRPRTWLRWSHGRKYQGGIGSYAPDTHPTPPVLPLLRNL